MLEDAISYPLRGDSALGRVFVGGLLGLFGFLLLPLFVLFGYLLRVLANAAREPEADPPEFEDWGDLFVEGLKGTAVAIVYGIVPFLVVGIAGGFGVAATATRSGAARGVFGGLGVIGVLVAFVVFVGLYYLLPAALTRLALEGRIGAAFEFGALKSVLLSPGYLVAWLLPFVIAFVVNAAMFVFVLVTLGLGALVIIVLGPFIQFYLQLVVFYLFGRAYGAATDAVAA